MNYRRDAPEKSGTSSLYIRVKSKRKRRKCLRYVGLIKIERYIGYPMYYAERHIFPNREKLLPKRELFEDEHSLAYIRDTKNYNI